MPIIISGSNGISGVDGTAAAPAVQGTDGNTGVFFPAADQVALAANGAQVLLGTTTGVTVAGTLQANGVTGSLYPLVLGTAQASTSGTSIDFTGIPSWARRVTVMFNGVSTNGTSTVQIQLGSTSFVTSGYSCVASGFALSNANTLSFTSGIVTGDSSTAAMIRFGSIVFTNVSGNAWVADGGLALPGTGKHICSGGVTLPGTLDRVRITTVGGTDTFDAGSINIMWE